MSVASHSLRKKTREVLLLPDDTTMARNNQVCTDDFGADPDVHPAVQEKVALHEPDGVLDFLFGLGAVGFAYSGDEPEMGEKVLKFRIPLVVAGTDCLFEDHRFDVVIQDLLGIAAKVVERMEVARDEGGDIGRERELHEAHPGIPENYAEAVHGLLFPVDGQIAAIRPVHLCLDTGVRFEPEDR